MRYQIWNKVDSINTPSGKAFTAEEWMEEYPWTRITGAKMIITTGIINGGVAMEFEKTKEFYKQQGAEITDDMTDDEVLRAIEYFEDNPPVPEENTPEERIAAALELSNVMNLPTVNDDDPDEDIA